MWLTRFHTIPFSFQYFAIVFQQFWSFSNQELVIAIRTLKLSQLHKEVLKVLKSAKHLLRGNKVNKEDRTSINMVNMYMLFCIFVLFLFFIKVLTLYFTMIVSTIFSSMCWQLRKKVVFLTCKSFVRLKPIHLFLAISRTPKTKKTTVKGCTQRNIGWNFPWKWWQENGWGSIEVPRAESCCRSIWCRQQQW